MARFYNDIPLPASCPNGRGLVWALFGYPPLTAVVVGDIAAD